MTWHLFGVGYKRVLLEIELEKEAKLEYIGDIKLEFKDKEVYFGNFI